MNLVDRFESNNLVIERALTEEQILLLLVQFDSIFARSITSRVGALDVHARKLADNALVYYASSGGIIAGFVAFYSNDRTSMKAFITHLAVSDKYRGERIGVRLVQAAKVTAKQSGMTRMNLEVDTENISAIKFYEALGFSVIGAADSASVFMSCEHL